MSKKCDCCGCHLEPDYGTSLVSGSGITEDPYSVSQVDPTFQRPVSRIERTTSQSIPNNTPTAITFTSVALDSHSMFDAGNPTRLTIPIAGIYVFGFNGKWSFSTAQTETFFRANGSQDLDRQSQYDTVIQDPDFNTAYQWFFQPGEYIEVVVLQVSGGNLNINVPLNFWAFYTGKKFP